ncbi:hypothetical protein BD414DRAFT_99069 [Trametes punicea]|nr:hypothetical protein BD414DRAFT_99069 [Trametes punicea]
MSQRVQKGNTVFKPVAKPRPRVGGESRQPSVLQDTAAATSPRNVLEPPVSKVPFTPSPMSVPQRHPTESSISENAAQPTHMPSVNSGIGVTASSSSRHVVEASVVSSALPLVSGNQPSQLSPRVGSSQSSPRVGVAISVPSRTMLQVPPFPPTVTSIVPVGHSSTTGSIAEPGSTSGGHSFASPSTAGFASHSAPPSDPFDSSQIDPQLMGPPGLADATPPLSQDIIPTELSAEHISTVNPSDIPSEDQVRRTLGGKPSAGSEQAAEGVVTHDSAQPGSGPAKERRPSKATVDGEDNAEQSTTRKRKRSETAEPRRSRKRASSTPPFDPDADPGEELDPTSVTMASLCDDTGRGRVSSKAAQVVSNHAAWRAANREKRARLKAVMEAKKYGRKVEDEEGGARSVSNGATRLKEQTASSASRAGSVAFDPTAASAPPTLSEEVEKGIDGFDYTEEMTVSRYNVQVRIGANGETIIDEESLFVNRNEEHQTEDYTHVEESDLTKFVNSATYSKKLRGSRWSAEETEMFYDALSQFGENYELISYVLPGRDRKACKNKFKAEDKKNPARITYCLKNRRPYDIATLSRMTGKDFSGPTPEIRAPTPLRSTELQTKAEFATPPSPQAVRKSSRTPSMQGPDVEVVDDIDGNGKEDEEIGQEVGSAQA